MIATGGIQIDPGGSLGMTLSLVAFLFACSFFFSGTETALFSLQAIDRQQLAKGGRASRMVVRLLGRRAATLTTILIGNEFANTLLAATTAALTLRFFPEKPWLNIVVLTPTLVLVSEITPKYAAIRANRLWSTLAAFPLVGFALVVTPVRVVFEYIIITMARLFRADPVAFTEGLEEAELLQLVERGAAAGSLDETEAEIIGNVFDLDELPLERVMTPRPDLFQLPVDIHWDALIDACKETAHSRVPIFEPKTNDIIGVLLVKDLLRLRERPERRRGSRWLYPLLLPPVFVPTSKRSDEMLREFIRRKYHMAFVVDEHGTLVGLVTLDDLVLEILGEEQTDDSEIAHLRPNTLRVKAQMDLEDFAEETGIELPEGDYHTVGGYVFHLFGRLPSEGQRVSDGAHEFTIVEMDNRRLVELEVASRPLGTLV